MKQEVGFYRYIFCQSDQRTYTGRWRNVWRNLLRKPIIHWIMAEESISQLRCKADDLMGVIEYVTARYKVAQYEGNSHYMTELATVHDKLSAIRANVDCLVSKLPKSASTDPTVSRGHSRPKSIEQTIKRTERESTYPAISYESRSTDQIQKRNLAGRAKKDSGVFSADSDAFECSEEMIDKESINQLCVKLDQLKDVLDNVRSRCIIAKTEMDSKYTSKVLAVSDKLHTIRDSVDALISHVSQIKSSVLTQTRDIKGRENRDSGLSSVTSSVLSSRSNSFHEDSDLNFPTKVEENVPAGPEKQCPSGTPHATNETVEQESTMKSPSENEDIQSLKPEEDENEDIQSLKSEEDNSKYFSTRM
ncbi:uncharacterized protein [Argopecten irradians]|uniref:uncharacterized protein n=1 Tax=Argopecten irradians TaxID=31199 RepID=UPI00372105C2